MSSVASLTCCVLLLSGELVTLSTVLGWSYVLSASTELGSELTETREPCLCSYIDNVDNISTEISPATWWSEVTDPLSTSDACLCSWWCGPRLQGR